MSKKLGSRYHKERMGTVLSTDRKSATSAHKTVPACCNMKRGKKAK